MADGGMDVARLGIIVDANGARREISLTSAELAKLADQSVRTGAALGGSSGPVPPTLPPRIDKITEAIARMRAAAARKLDLGLAEQIALLDPYTQRTSIAAATTDRLRASMDRMRAAAAQKADLALASQLALLDPFEKRIDRVTLAIQRMKAASAQRGDLIMAGQIALLDPFQQRVDRTTNSLSRIAPVAAAGRLSLGRLGNQFAGLAGSIAGVHPVVGNILGVMGNFAIGSAWTVGIIAGVAAIAVIYDRLTGASRALKKANEETLKSFEDMLYRESLGPAPDLVLGVQAERNRFMQLRSRKRTLTAFGVDDDDQRILNLNHLIEGSQKRLIAGEALLTKARLDAGEPLKTVEITGRNIKKDIEDAAKAEKQFADNVQRAKDASLEMEFAAVRGSQSIEQQKVEALKLRDAARQGAAAYEAAADEIEIMNALAAAGIPIFDHRYEAAKRDLQVARDARREAEARVQADKKIAEEIVEAQKAAADQQAQISENLTREMQENFSTFFQNTLTDGLSSFRKLFSAIRDMFIKLIADILAARLMQRFGGAIAGVLGGAIGGAAGAGGETAGIAGLGASMLGPVGIGAAGGMIGYQLGQGARSGLGGGIRGAAGGALAGAAIGSIVPGIGTAVGAFIGGVAGFVGGVFGAGKAAKEAAREMKKLQDQLALTMEGWRANLRGDELGVALAESMARLKAMLLAINAAYPGTQNEPERNRQRAEAEALQREEARQIREQFEQQRQYAREDLQVRMLRAQGNSAEADALAFANQQQREYTAAVQAGADAAYLAMLTQVHAAEAVARAIGTLQDAVRNAPTGFTIEAYGGGPRNDGGGILGPFDGPPLPPPQPVPGVPQPPGGGGGGGEGTQPMVVLQFSDGAFVLTGNESPEQLVRKMLRGARSIAAATVGSNMPISKALDLIPSN